MSYPSSKSHRWERPSGARCLPILAAVVATGIAIAGSLSFAGAPDPTAAALAALESDRVEVRRLALWSLTDQRLAVESMGELLPLVESRDPLTQRYAQDALQSQGAAAIPLLLAHLRQQPRSRAAEEILAALAPDSVPGLVELGTSEAPLAARRGALRTLATAGPRAAEQATTPLLAALRTAPHRTERTVLADTLGSLGEAALPELLRAAADAPELGEYISMAIARMDTETTDALDFLQASLSSTQPRQRFSAARALGNIGPAAAPSLPALKENLLRDPNTSVRLYSAEALGRIAPTSPSVRTTLLQALPQADAPVATKIIAALAAGGPAGIPALKQQLQSNSAQTRARIVAALRDVDGAPVERVKLLIERLDDPSESVRDAAALALRHSGDQAPAALIEGLRDARPRVRAYVAMVCGQIEPAMTVALPGLMAGLTDTDLTVRQMSAWALGKFGPLASAAALPLVQAMNSPNELLRRNAAWALGTLGVRDIEPQLERYLTDPSTQVVSEVEEALAKLRGTYRKVERE